MHQNPRGVYCWEVLIVKSVLYRTVPVPGGQDEVAQGQVHGGVAGKLRKFIQLVQLHHIGSHTQGLPTLIGLIEGLEVWTQPWN